MKTAWIDFLRKNKGKALTTKQLLNYVAGNYDAEDEKELSNAMFVFDKMMAALFSHSYHKKTKYYAPPYECKMEVSKKPLFTASNRALCVLMIENCRTKWQNIYEIRKTDPKAPIPHKPNKDDVDNPNWKYHKARWSTPDGGQCKFTSWDPEGLAKLAKWTAKIAAFMKNSKGQMQENEDKFLVYYQREASGVEVGDTEPGGKKRKRNGQEVPQRKKIDLGLGGEKKNYEDFSDDDEEEQEEEEEEQEEEGEKEEKQEEEGDGDDDGEKTEAV